jgi:Zn-dependent protease with chaperone function
MVKMSESATPTASGQRFVPRDRESFFDAQRRNRRATWRMSVLCVLAAVVIGIPLALVVTPLLYAVALIVADIINYFSPLPAAIWQFSTDLARFGLVALGWLLQQKHADPQALAIGAVVMLLPGVMLSIALWVGVNMMFHRSGVGGALLALKARKPNQAELKELQLADVVQEMAIASGLPTPQVMLVDSPGANAAAIGTSPNDARIVVSRRLVDDLSRDELEAVLAHLIASIGNGDLHIAFRMTAVLETCGLLVAFINSPFGPQSRRILWKILRYALRGSVGKDDAQEAAAIAELLSRTSNLETDDIDNFFDPGTRKSKVRSIRNFLFFPIFFTNVAIKLSLWFFSIAVLGPAMALLWRTRCYLADASAVQLTRNPDSLASALQKLSHEPGEIPGGDWASHLFFVNPKSGNRVAPDARQRKLLAQAWNATERGSAVSPASSGITDSYNLQPEFTSTVRAALAGDAQAAERLRAMHRSVQAADPAFAAQFPNPDDFLAARHGDTAALAKLLAVRKHAAINDDATQGTKQARSEQESNSSSVSLMGFHPSIERRLKRLARMGAHFEAAKSKTGMIALVLGLVLSPLILLIIALFLLLISIMTMASLVFLVVWLAFIHKIFALLPHAVAG